MSDRKKSSKRKKPLPLPKAIRDELRLTCALKGFSAIKCGKSQKAPEQRERLSKKIHGKPPNRPPQIKLLSEGDLNYSDLYDEVDIQVTSKSYLASDPKRKKLKESLTCDMSRVYYIGVDITHDDLEKRNRTGNQLITGRNLLDLCVKGVKNYKKALAFCEHKWDIEKCEPKNSGDSMEDVVQYVRANMYKTLHKSHDYLVEESETEEIAEVLPGTDGNVVTTTTDNHNTGTNTTDCNEDHLGHNNEEHGTDDNNNNLDNDSSASKSDSKSINSFEDMPSDCIFPSFFVFMMWGPFVPPNKKLPLMLTTKGKGSRVKDRNKELKDKMEDAATDTTHVRGFSTDQRIDIENLNVRKQALCDRQREQSIVGFSIEEAALGRQIETAERRAAVRCPVYDPTNVHWQRVDRLIEEQDEVIQRIRDFNEHKVKPPPVVTQFLDKDSPEKSIPASIDISTTAVSSDSVAPSSVNVEISQAVSNQKDNEYETVDGSIDNNASTRPISRFHLKRKSNPKAKNSRRVSNRKK